jgi:hypothetical protein
MSGIWRMVGLLVVIAMVSALAGAQAMAFSPVADHPAGCHGHTPAAPVPAPTSYLCCATGHHAVLPNAPFSLHSGDAQLCRLDAGWGLNLAVAVFRPLAVLVAPSNSPPITAALRI